MLLDIKIQKKTKDTVVMAVRVYAEARFPKSGVLMPYRREYN